ncbi:hypothetical protein GZH47_15090 [Paenibacillus rhizovicinus]|uniref:Anti-sigma-W factor RsiW n=1 Tax=Paenibacillus rhizovicinus TaxID=2704463 RepID=A0A6C0P0J3_9BACL|nr:anti-sigma factor [Paenibacillus rhizovicinus]QHW32004.1 hypothetical protein GZH47_15090 [Paenibacillus rhizovicinus]
MVLNENKCENAELYALGGLNEEERAAFEAHLAGCEACALQVKELQTIIDLLPLSAEPVHVPAGMQDRILGNILGSDSAPKATATPGGESSGVSFAISPAASSGVPLAKTDSESSGIAQSPSPSPQMQASVQQTAAPIPSLPFPSSRRQPAQRGWRTWMNVALAAAVVLLGAYVFTLKDQVSDLRRELTATTEPPQGLRPNEAVSLSAAAQDIVASGLATIVIDTNGTHLLVQAEKLPQLKGNEAFQVWLMKDGSGVVNAGTFVSRDGTGGLYLTLDRNLSGYNQIAITLEPDAFGQLPRGTAVLAAAIKL